MAYRYYKIGGIVRNAHLVRTAGIASIASIAVSQYRYAKCNAAIVQPMAVVEAPKAIAISSMAAVRETDEEGHWVYRGAQKMGRFLKYLYRFLTISTIASPMTVLGPSAFLLGKYVPALEEMAWGYLVWAINQLGPAFIKLGQWASTRPDLYPPKVIDKLIALQDNVKSAHSLETVEETLTDSFGPHWRERLILNPKPIGAGCIAQVFQGTLIGEDSLVTQSSQARSSSTDRKTAIAKDCKERQVAVKVIHPHVEAMLKTDMELLSMFAVWLDGFSSLKNLSLGDSATQFSKCMTDQIDMKLEAKNLIVFRKKWANEKWASFPEPITGMITKNVLVETLMDGTSIEKYMAMSDIVNGKVDNNIRKLRSKLSDMGARAMIKMIFFDNFIHGDLHPGNILVKFDDKGEPHMIFLDCGIVFSSKDKKDHETIVEICVAFMQHDGRKAAKLMIDHSKNGAVPTEMEGFIEGVHRIVVECKEHNYFEHIGEYVMRICNLARDYNVKLDPGYFHIAMALKVAEGISLSLDRTLDMVTKCLPVVVRAKAYQAMGIEDFSMSQVAQDLEKTQAELDKQETIIREQVKKEKAANLAKGGK